MARKKCAYEQCERQEQRSGVCATHYWDEYRMEIVDDVDDYWQWVKEYLKIA